MVVGGQAQSAIVPFAEKGALRSGRLEPFYQQVHEGAPFRDPATQLWVVSGYDDVRRILHDAERFANFLTLIPHYPVCPEALELLQTLDAPGTTAGGDGELHRRARQAITATFPAAPAKVENQLGEIVRRNIKLLIAGFADAARPYRSPRDDGESAASLAEIDLIGEFAWQLPLRVICDLIGIPTDRFGDVKAWSEGQIALVWGQLDDAEQVRSARGLLKLWELCEELVADRKAGRNGPTSDDLAGRLVAYRDRAGEPLSDKEVASILLNFAVAGHETTANAISNSLFHLLAHRSLWDDVVANPDSVPAVAEELLRLHPPIIGWSRVTTREVEVAGTTIPANERVLLLLGAANRDERFFADPNRLDPHRDRIHSHLSFGVGIHHCVGAPLARLELTEALRTLATTHPELTLRPGQDETTAEYAPNIGFRALVELPVLGRFRSAA